MKLRYTLIVITLGFSAALMAQSDSLTKYRDTMSRDAMMNRPFINANKILGTSIGGYIEANTNYFAEDGVSEGFSMEMRRFNIFIFADIHPKIKMLSELEFEHGTEEIALETALLDFTFHDLLNFRAGIILPMLGKVNANHDSPKWNFIDRPLSSTQIIPSTLSEVGFGLFGKHYMNKWSMSYDIYLVNGIGEGIILNTEGKTHMPSGKSEEMFEEDNNGTPMFNGRLGLRRRKLGEIGIAYYGGTYNNFRIEGEEVTEKKNLHIIAFDWELEYKKWFFQGEYVNASIDIPVSLAEIYGSKQSGGFIDVSYELLKKKILGFKKTRIYLDGRLEWVDLNTGTFSGTGTNIGDDIKGIVAGISLRPSSSAVLKANYRYHWIRDVLGNPPAHLAGFQFGFATYF